MISHLQKRLFTSILQNSYFEKLKTDSHKNVMESFFRINTFKSLKEVMESFSMLKALRIFFQY